MCRMQGTTICAPVGAQWPGAQWLRSNIRHMCVGLDFDYSPQTSDVLP